MATTICLFAADFHASVMFVTSQPPRKIAYAPFGLTPPARSGPLSIQFNGQPREALLGHYLLGNGYRLFNCALLRFNSPDSLSPYGAGGINAYAYCHADPVNGIDPSGHINLLRNVLPGVLKMNKTALRAIGRRQTPLFAERAPRIIGPNTPISSGKDVEKFFKASIVTTNTYVSREFGPTALANARAAGFRHQDISPFADFGDKLFATDKTPLSQLITLHAEGNAFERSLARQTLEDIFSMRYESHLAGDRARMIRGINRELKTGKYPDAWYVPI